MIDLGELRGSADRGTGGRWMSATTWRSLATSLIVLACLAGVSGSAGFEPVWTQPLWTGHVGQIGLTMGSGTAYTSTDSNHAIAYDLSTGTVRWRRGVDRPLVAIYDLGGGVVVLSSRVMREFDDTVFLQDAQATLVDERTGDVITRVAGIPAAQTPSGHLLVLERRSRADGSPCRDPDPACLDLVAVHRRSGARLWQMPITDLVLPRFSGDQRALVAAGTFATVAGTRQISVHDADSAATRARLTMPESGPTRLAGAQPGLAGDVVVTTRPTDRGVEVTRLAPAGDGAGSARAVWSRLVGQPVGSEAPVGAPSGAIEGVYACARVLCVGLGDATALVDPETGIMAAIVTGRVSGQLGGGDLLVAQPTPLAELALLSRHRLHVVGGDGRTLASFPHSALVPWGQADGRALLAQQGDNRVGFIVLDQAGRAYPLGSVSGVNLLCRAHADVLACADALGRLAVWRLPGWVRDRGGPVQLSR